MLLNIQTLYFANVAVLVIIAITALLYWWENRDQVGLLEWAIATAVVAQAS